MTDEKYAGSWYRKFRRNRLKLEEGRHEVRVTGLRLHNEKPYYFMEGVDIETNAPFNQIAFIGENFDDEMLFQLADEFGLVEITEKTTNFTLVRFIRCLVIVEDKGQGPIIVGVVQPTLEPEEEEEPKPVSSGMPDDIPGSDKLPDLDNEAPLPKKKRGGRRKKKSSSTAKEEGSNGNGSSDDDVSFLI